SSFFFQPEDGIRDGHVTGVQTCALPIWAYPVYVPVPYGYPAYSIPTGVPYGGISFGGLTPYDASVFVDGAYVGVASTFDGTRQPLTLAAGPHRIELQAPGYAPIAFDVDV